MSYAPIGSEIIVSNGGLSNGQRNAFINKRSSRSSSSSRSRVRKRKSSNGNGSNGSNHSSNYPIIVHCHLCWDWVWQRPQQFVSRLSRRHQILFVETIGPDPQLSSPVARFSNPENCPNVTVLRLQFPSWRWNDGAFVDRERRRLVQEFLGGPGKGRFENAVQWFYDPMAVPAFAGRMNEIATVYDCMDELSSFRCAPPEIREREAQLLKLADVVFTGGYKLYESKSRFNGNCHFHGCGVDVAHFGKARDAATPIPDDLAAVKQPALGYFGVVDERMDYDLIAQLADANPEWSIVMVGPCLKVDEKTLPRRPNIYWLGARPYGQLPAYCKGLDVCLMPFALNEATEYINPTKALEYMATGTPIVSTAVPDVVRNFGSVVSVAKSPDHFVELCRRAIEAPDQAAIDRGLKMAADNTWDRIVAQLENHVSEALLRKQTLGVTA